MNILKRTGKILVAATLFGSIVIQATVPLLAGNYYTTYNVNLRSEAGTSSTVLALVVSNTEVDVTEFNPDGWSKVSYNGKTGWIKSEFLRPVDESAPEPAPSPVKWFALANLNIRSGPNTDSEILALAKLGTELNITEYAEDGWSKIIYNEHEGFVSSQFIGTQEQLENSTRPSRSNVEFTHWDEARNIFAVGLTAKVYDIHTGISYNVRSFSNGRHADVETVTQEDTALMKRTFGGVWSWAVRPVWVTVNGRTMAASINGMPHGGGTISNNGMNGQVCIHFRGSSTHNGNASFTRLHQQKAE